MPDPLLGQSVVSRDVPTLIHDGDAWVRAQHYDDKSALLREAVAELNQRRRLIDAQVDGMMAAIENASTRPHFVRRLEALIDEAEGQGHAR